jgi:3',5'-cyclic AMP phosphodiesterase CpdA
VRLLAISDLHLGHAPNRDALEQLGHYPGDWLIIAGDVGERTAHLELALRHCSARFQQVIWTPGNHDLWASAGRETTETRGQRRYEELVAICREHGVLTPEDPYIRWPDDPDTFLVPMFLLYDYSFRPESVPLEGAVAWARERGIGCADEQFLDPSPWPSRGAWCRERCAATAARLITLPAGARTILINHWPLRYDLARPPRIPRFSIWCGTTVTEDWGVRFNARAVISGHLHMRTTLWRDGVRYEEVSFGYPRDWSADRGIDWYLRQILPDTPAVSDRFVPRRDPFEDKSRREH